MVRLYKYTQCDVPVTPSSVASDSYTNYASASFGQLWRSSSVCPDLR